MREPGSGHPITISRHPGRVQVRFNGRLVVDTTNALSLAEASYPAVLYAPREDADMAAFAPSARRTTCPYKGEASYFTLQADGKEAVDAVWSYEAPFPAVAEIAGRLAFYADRVEIVRTPD